MICESNDDKLDQTIASYFETLFRVHKLRFKSPKTIYKYRLELKRLDRFLGRPALLADLTDAVVGDAAEFILSKEKNGLGLSVESARGFIGRINRVWEFLARKRIVHEFPTIENLRKVKRIPRAMTREQLKTLWEALQRQPGKIGDISTADWFSSFVAVMWRTSERPQAMLKIRRADVDLKRGWIIVPPENRKGGCQGRAYKIEQTEIEWLERIWYPERELVWPWPHQYEYLFPRYKEILRCAGLPCGRDWMFSAIRRSHATHLEAAGGDATLSLGHASRETTVGHYLDPTMTGKESGGEKLFRLGD